MLGMALQTAVPLWIDRLRPLGLQAILARAMEINALQDSTGQRLVGSDALIHRRDGDTANAFNALAEGVACLAFAPGGVPCFGVRFDASLAFPYIVREDKEHAASGQVAAVDSE